VKKMMRTVVLGASVLGIVGTMAPAAFATSPLGDNIKGGCFFNTDENALATNGQNQGTIGDASVTTDGSGAPTGATVECYIKVDNNKQGQTDNFYTGVGAQGGQNNIVFTADATSTVELCENVTYADGSKEAENCQVATSQNFPPDAVVSLIDTVIGTAFDTINLVLSKVDTSALCIITKALGPQDVGGLGLITIDANGSLTITDPLGLVVLTNSCV